MEKKLKIAFFVNNFPKISETFILRQITGLIDLGHEVDIYADARPQEGDPTHPEVMQYGLLARTTYMDMPREAGYWEMPVWPITGRTWLPDSETSVLNAVRILKAVPKLFRCLRASPRLTLKVLNFSEYGCQAHSLSALYRHSILCSRSRTYDVLHAHFGPIGNSFSFAKELWNAPFVVSFHGFDFSMWPRRQGPDIYRRLFDTVDAVTVNSKYTRRRLEELGCPSIRLHSLPVGLDPDDFVFHERARISHETVRILTVGRLVEKKGLEYSIRAVARVRGKQPNIRYDIIGEGPLRPKLEELIHQLGVEETISLHGARDRTYVRQLMAEAHLFVLASVTAENGDQEGQGLVLQEAQASGLPVLATDHTGFSERIVPGQSGFLVPERDVDGLDERLTYLVEHPEDWPDMGRKGRKHVEEHYNNRSLNRELVELYKQVIVEYRTKGARMRDT